MKAERRGFIYSRVGVRIAGHPRFLRIPTPKRAAALGVWLAALSFTREEQLDGFCPLEAIQTIASKDIVDRLVEVGLFAREEQDGIHGVRILKYEEFNDTKAEIDDARARDRTRKHDARHAGRPPSVPPPVRPDTQRKSDARHAEVPSLGRGRDRERDLPAPAPEIQDNTGEAPSGTVLAGEVLRTDGGEPELNARRAKALADVARLAADPTFAAGGGR